MADNEDRYTISDQATTEQVIRLLRPMVRTFSADEVDQFVSDDPKLEGMFVHENDTD